MRTTEELFNAITSNGCREMELTRFTQALAEHDQEIIQMIDEGIKELRNDNYEINFLLTKDERRQRIMALTNLKQKLGKK